MAREKASALGQIKAIDDDIYRSAVRTLKYVLFKNHPYRFQSAGRSPVIKGLSRKQVVDYYRTYYAPNNMILIIAGSVDKDAVRQKAARLFGQLKGREAPEIKVLADRKRAHARIITRKTEKEQSLILLGYPGAALYSHDKYVLEVLCSVLSGVNGRLSRSVREEKGLAYALDAVSSTGIEPGMIMFYIATTKDKLATAKDTLLGEIDLLKKKGISGEELRAAKNELIGAHLMGLQKIQDAAVRAGIDELYGLGHDNLLKYEERIKRISADCVERAARKYLNDNSYVLLTVRGLQ